jgi:membrane-bound ClpP family serine protease
VEFAILLFLVGIAIAIVELFIPSMGILALGAGAAFVSSIVVAFGESTTLGVVFLVGTVIIVPTLFVVAFKVLPSTPVGRRLFLPVPDRSTVERGSDVSSDPLHELLGCQGRATSDLRPAGLVEVDGRRVDVITGGEWIEAGADVTVTEVEGNRVVVRADTPADPDSQS